MDDCEPLRGKIRYKDINWSVKPYGNYIQANLKVDDVASAVRFYKRYRVMPHLLEKEEAYTFSKWIKFAREHKLNPYYSEDEFQSYEFQCWLFDYCFGDVKK